MLQAVIEGSEGARLALVPQLLSAALAALCTPHVHLFARALAIFSQVGKLSLYSH